MKAVKGIKVESCVGYSCSLYGGCREKYKGRGYNIPPTCPLPVWPSVTTKFLMDLGFEIRRNLNLDYIAGNDLEIARRLTVVLKSIGVTIKEEKDEN